MEDRNRKMREVKKLMTEECQEALWWQQKVKKSKYRKLYQGERSRSRLKEEVIKGLKDIRVKDCKKQAESR